MARRRVLGEQGQADFRCALVTAERIRLVVPIHVAQGSGVAIQVVLGLFVVSENCFCGRFRHVDTIGQKKGDVWPTPPFIP
jgi:hypothetical protein